MPLFVDGDPTTKSVHGHVRSCNMICMHSRWPVVLSNNMVQYKYWQHLSVASLKHLPCIHFAISLMAVCTLHWTSVTSASTACTGTCK